MLNFASRTIAWWDLLAARWNPVAIIVAAWALLTLPLVFFRGYHSDEGLAVTIARTAVEEGHWLTPYAFNVRVIERPTLLSWIIAAFSAPFGGVTQFTARLPVALFLLAGCLSIYWLLRRVSASVPAALLGAMLFLACPLVLRANVMVTADMPLAVLLFVAFMVWWDGCANGRIGIGRWIVIGVVLALAAQMKGPQPISFFALGVGLSILWSRAWNQIPGFVLAGVICVIPLAGWYYHVYRPGDAVIWIEFMRLQANEVVLHGPAREIVTLALDLLPATILAASLFIGRYAGLRGPAPDAFIRATACYAAVSALLILFWPGGSAPRYFFPMILPLCVFGGLAYDALKTQRPQAVAPGLNVMLVLLVYGAGYSLVSPFLPMKFRSTQVVAAEVAKLVSAAPAPIYRVRATWLNVMPYVPAKIVNTEMDDLETLQGPAWIAATDSQAAKLLAKRPDVIHEALPLSDGARLLRLDKK